MYTASGVGGPPRVLAWVSARWCGLYTLPLYLSLVCEHTQRPRIGWSWSLCGGAQLFQTGIAQVLWLVFSLGVKCAVISVNIVGSYMLPVPGPEHHMSTCFVWEAVSLSVLCDTLFAFLVNSSHFSPQFLKIIFTQQGYPNRLALGIHGLSHSVLYCELQYGGNSANIITDLPVCLNCVPGEKKL